MMRFALVAIDVWKALALVQRWPATAGETFLLRQDFGDWHNIILYIIIIGLRFFLYLCKSNNLFSIMKKVALVLLMVAAVVASVSAQSANMSIYGKSSGTKSVLRPGMPAWLDLSAELVAGPGVNESASAVVGLNFIGYYKQEKHLLLGLGVGLDYAYALTGKKFSVVADEALSESMHLALLPVFLRGKVLPQEFGKWTPFVMLDLGYAFRLGNDNGLGGLMFEPALGTDVAIGTKYSLSLALGFHWSQTQYYYEGYWFRENTVVSSSSSSLLLHASFNF